MLSRNIRPRIHFTIAMGMAAATWQLLNGPVVHETPLNKKKKQQQRKDKDTIAKKLMVRRHIFMLAVLNHNAII